MLLDSFAQWPGLAKFSRGPKLRIVIWIPAQKYFFFLFYFSARKKTNVDFSQHASLAKNGEKCSLWQRLVGEGRFWYGITCFIVEVCWNDEPKTLHFPLVVSERASSFYQLAELLSLLSSIFFFFSSEHEIDLDFQTLIRIPNKTYMIVCFVFVSGFRFFTFDFNFVFGREAACPSGFCQVSFLCFFK